MGLNEKRKVKELQEVTFPARTKELAEIAGTPITYEIDWASLADDGEALNFIDNISCHRVNMAMRVICADALGREAVKQALKTIKLKNVKTLAEKKLAFAAGVLEMSCAYALHLDGAFSDVEIRAVLERGL